MNKIQTTVSMLAGAAALAAGLAACGSSSPAPAGQAAPDRRHSPRSPPTR